MTSNSKPATSKGLRRSDLARTTGCHLETIRYYEDIGILQRLRFVMRARELGFSLDDIRGLLGLGDRALPTCGEVRDRTEHHLSDIRAKIADLRRIEKVLATTAAQCSGEDVPECALLDSLYR